MTIKKEALNILGEIRDIDNNNIFLRYLVKRLRSDDYRGWHISQHNRYDLNDIKAILESIYNVVKDDHFTIPPGDYKRNASLPTDFMDYDKIVKSIKSKIERGTINSIKKNFFPDLERMGFIRREKILHINTPVLAGILTKKAIEFINAKTLIDRYKIFTDGVDKLFGMKISKLADMIHLSDYSDDRISIYEFMFILSDCDKNLNKIELLTSYRS